MNPCECQAVHRRRRIVLTGGPGAGKTAVLELIRQAFCSHVKVLPESAGIIFGGGFPRGGAVELQKAAQRAIFYVQRELETAADAQDAAIVLCDRGTVDSLAYWHGPDDLWTSLGTTLDEQLKRYDVVIHLRTLAGDNGYNHQNPLRTESPKAAAEIDRRLLAAWTAHGRRFVIEASSNFLDKAGRAVEVLRAEIPVCCKQHILPLLHAKVG